MTENVAEQTKQLSNRIAECERLRVQVDTMQEEIDTTTTGLVESHKEELSSQLAALQKKHLEELTCCKEDLNDVQKEKDGYEKAYEEVGQEVAELRATNQEHVAIINTISQEREQSIKDCAQQILAFNERNEAITSVSKLMVVGGRWWSKITFLSTIVLLILVFLLLLVVFLFSFQRRRALAGIARFDCGTGKSENRIEKKEFHR